MFLVITLLALWLGWELQFIRARCDYLAQNAAAWEAALMRRTLGPTGPRIVPYEDSELIPVWRRWLGDKTQYSIFLPPDCSEEFEALARRLFPEARVTTWQP